MQIVQEYDGINCNGGIAIMGLEILAPAIGWLSIAVHTWSIRYHFNVQKLPAGAKLISLMVLASAILLTYLSLRHTQSVIANSIGSGLMLASLVLFWITIRESSRNKLLAVFDEGLPHGLITTGPYRFVRHPFYSSYILLWIGWAVAAWHLWAIVPVATMVTTYWAAARDEEYKFSKTDMSVRYKEYKTRTGRFVPQLPF